jgi:hypothetical protein
MVCLLDKCSACAAGKHEKCINKTGEGRAPAGVFGGRICQCSECRGLQLFTVELPEISLTQRLLNSLYAENEALKAKVERLEARVLTDEEYELFDERIRELIDDRQPDLDDLMFLHDLVCGKWQVEDGDT